MLAAAHRANCDFASIDILRLGPLGEEHGSRLSGTAGDRQQVAINEETRDLLLQQFDSSPVFHHHTAAGSPRTKLWRWKLTRDCEQLYVDELMGGRIGRYFASLLEEIAPQSETRRSLLRILFESRDSAWTS